MGAASTHFDVSVYVTLLVVVKFSVISVAYYCALVGVGSGHGLILCYRTVAVVAHMEHGDISGVLFGMSGWDSWVGPWWIGW